MSGILIIDTPSKNPEHPRCVSGSLELPVAVEFASGERTLERLLDDDLPDVIVIDVQESEEMDGVEMIPRLRERAPEATIVACGYFEDAAAVSELFEIGAHRCLKKPIQNESLLKLVPKHLREPVLA